MFRQCLRHKILNLVIFGVLLLFQNELIYSLKWQMTYWLVESFVMYCSYVCNQLICVKQHKMAEAKFTTREPTQAKLNEQSRSLTENSVV